MEKIKVKLKTNLFALPTLLILIFFNQRRCILNLNHNIMFYNARTEDEKRFLHSSLYVTFLLPVHNHLATSNALFQVYRL